MTAEKYINKLTKKVEKLHAARFIAFYGPEEKYEIINNQLNNAMEELEKFISFRTGDRIFK